jgi:hypothetical protein
MDAQAGCAADARKRPGRAGPGAGLRLPVPQQRRTVQRCGPWPRATTRGAPPTTPAGVTPRLPGARAGAPPPRARSGSLPATPPRGDGPLPRRPGRARPHLPRALRALPRERRRRRRGDAGRVLAEEVVSGRVDYHSTSRRYRLNGGLDAATVAALRGLAAPEASETGTGRCTPSSRPTRAHRRDRVAHPRAEQALARRRGSRGFMRPGAGRKDSLGLPCPRPASLWLGRHE